MANILSNQKLRTNKVLLKAIPFIKSLQKKKKTCHGGEESFRSTQFSRLSV